MIFKPTPLVRAMSEAGVMNARYHMPYTYCSWPTFLGAYINWNKLREALNGAR